MLAWLALLTAGGLRAEEPVVVDSDSPDCNCCAGMECCLPPPRPTWYVDTEGIALKRTVLDRINIASLGPMPGNLLVLDRDDLDQPFQAGPRILIGHTFLDTPYQIEFSFFDLGDWDATTGVRSDSGNLFTRFTNFGARPSPGSTTTTSFRFTNTRTSTTRRSTGNARSACPPTAWR